MKLNKMFLHFDKKNRLKFRKLLFKFYYAICKFKDLLSKNRKHDSDYYFSYFKLLKKIKRNFYYTINDNVVYYDPIKSGIGHRIYWDGSFEGEELGICERFIENDSIILDIGANIGIHSVFYSKIAKEGSIFSFEPSRDTFTILLRNVKNLSNVIPFNLALSDKTEIVNFYECEDNALSGLKDTLRSPVRILSKVLCFRGDDFIPNLNLTKLDFIKIDVEGFEEQVLKGLEKTIRLFKPKVFCEIYKGQYSNLKPLDTINFIINLNYKAFVMSKDYLIPFVEHNDDLHNYLFLPQ